MLQFGSGRVGRWVAAIIVLVVVAMAWTLRDSGPEGSLSLRSEPAARQTGQAGEHRWLSSKSIPPVSAQDPNKVPDSPAPRKEPAPVPTVERVQRALEAARPGGRFQVSGNALEGRSESTPGSAELNFTTEAGALISVRTEQLDRPLPIEAIVPPGAAYETEVARDGVELIFVRAENFEQTIAVAVDGTVWNVVSPLSPAAEQGRLTRDEQRSLALALVRQA